MATKLILLLSLSASLSQVSGSSFLESSYDYVMSLGKSLAPNFVGFLDCLGEDDFWVCAKEKTGKILENWDKDVEKQRRSWQLAADTEVAVLGRSSSEQPSQLGIEVETSLKALADILQTGMARAMSRKKGSGIDTISISASGHEKKKIKKKKPPKIHIIQPMSTHPRKEKKGGFQTTGQLPVQSWVIGAESRNGIKNGNNGSGMENNGSGMENSGSGMENSRKSRGFMEDVWDLGGKAVDGLADHIVDSDNTENGLSEKSSSEEQRGKKKKKKILKLLILGAVLKAKIATLLQILSFKLQVKFFLIALIGLGINLARFWLELKNKHHQQPQKVIYYEHAQHQHHYDHEDDHHEGWGPWSRAISPEDEATDENEETEVQFSPYKGYERIAHTYGRPALTRV